MVLRYLAPVETGTGSGLRLETGRCQSKDGQLHSPINAQYLRRRCQDEEGHKGKATLDWARGTRPRPLDPIDSRPPSPGGSGQFSTRSTADPVCARERVAQIPQSFRRVPCHPYGAGTQRAAAIGTEGSKYGCETGSVPGGVASGSVANPLPHQEVWCRGGSWKCCCPPS